MDGMDERMDGNEGKQISMVDMTFDSRISRLLHSLSNFALSPHYFMLRLSDQPSYKHSMIGYKFKERWLSPL